VYFLLESGLPLAGQSWDPRTPNGDSAKLAFFLERYRREDIEFAL
jgi:hypothetical protein